MKNRNLLWGCRRIQGELAKLGIHISRETVRNIINDFRKKGKIKRSLTWKKFLKMHVNSIYAMDFFTIDTILNKRFYVYFIIHHKTRQIVQFAVTEFPVREFVRQQIIEFENSFNSKAYMIRDRANAFNLDYSQYNIEDICTPVKSPNLNPIAERFVGSVKREALDNFIIFNERQLRNILISYVKYYNFLRPHQGIDQNVPKGYEPQCSGNVLKKPVLDGLHHHYYRKAS